MIINISAFSDKNKKHYLIMWCSPWGIGWILCCSLANKYKRVLQRCSIRNKWNIGTYNHVSLLFKTYVKGFLSYNPRNIWCLWDTSQREACEYCFFSHNQEIKIPAVLSDQSNGRVKYSSHITLFNLTDREKVVLKMEGLDRNPCFTWNRINFLLIIVCF